MTLASRRADRISAAYVEMASDQFLDILDPDLFPLRLPYQIANGDLGHFHRHNSGCLILVLVPAFHRRMCDQPIYGAFEIAAIRLDHARDIGDDLVRNLESLM